MKLKTVLLIGFSMLAALSLWPNEASARPPDFTVQFNLWETPGEPASGIDFMITLGLMKDTIDDDNIGWDDSIGWKVALLTVRELDENGDVVNIWSMTDPFVDTADGLWWIEHADPDNPVLSEFTVPPRMQDIAPSPFAGVLPLQFDIAGNLYTAPPAGAPFPLTASLDLFLVEYAGEAGGPLPPQKEVYDEPVLVAAPSEPCPFGPIQIGDNCYPPDDDEPGEVRPEPPFPPDNPDEPY